MLRVLGSACLILVVLLLGAPAALAQIAPAPPTATASAEQVTLVQILVLLAAVLGSFLAYKSQEGAETISWRAAAYVIFSACASYAALYNSLVPEAWFSATTNPLTAAVLAVLVSGLAGALLVEMFRKILAGFQQTRSGGG